MELGGIYRVSSSLVLMEMLAEVGALLSVVALVTVMVMVMVKVMRVAPISFPLSSPPLFSSPRRTTHTVFARASMWLVSLYELSVWLRHRS